MKVALLYRLAGVFRELARWAERRSADCTKAYRKELSRR